MTFEGRAEIVFIDLAGLQAQRVTLCAGKAQLTQKRVSCRGSFMARGAIPLRLHSEPL